MSARLALALAAALAPFLLTPAAPAAAKALSKAYVPGDMCGRSARDSAQPLAGNWMAINRDGAGSVGPRGVLLKSRPKESLKLETSRPDMLVFTDKNDLGAQRMEMTPQTGIPNLPDIFNVPMPGGGIQEVNVKKLLPCSWGNMPGYKGHVDYPLPGVGEMRMTVWFNFPSNAVGFGMLHFTGSMMGNPIDVWRHVTLTRGKSMTLPACKPYTCESSDPKQCRAEHEAAREKDWKICPFPE